MNRKQKELQSPEFFGIKSTWSQTFLRLDSAITLTLSIFCLIQLKIHHLLSKGICDIVLQQINVICIYSTAKKPTSEESMNLDILKFCNRFVVSFLYLVAMKIAFIIVLNLIALVVMLVVYPSGFSNIDSATEYMISGILHSVGAWWPDLVFMLANRIWENEESNGYFQAIRKSIKMIKGKMGISIAIFLVRSLCSIGSLQVFKSFVEFVASNGGMGTRAVFYLCFGAISLLILTIGILLEAVVKMMFYLYANLLRARLV